MAWNPSPEVQVARDAAAKLGQLARCGVEQVVVLYVTDDGRMGSVTYGRDRALCAQAKVLGDKVYQRARDHFANVAV